MKVSNKFFDWHPKEQSCNVFFFNVPKILVNYNVTLKIQSAYEGKPLQC